VSVTVRSIASSSEVAALRLPELSDWFDPFQVHFMLATLRCRGGVAVAEAIDTGRRN
jgi:hypothetical protein